jgi:hypothetical protein
MTGFTREEQRNVELGRGLAAPPERLRSGDSAGDALPMRLA